MKEVAVSKILCEVFDKLHQRKIRKTNGYEFSAKDMSRIIKFFSKRKRLNRCRVKRLYSLTALCIMAL